MFEQTSLTVCRACSVLRFVLPAALLLMPRGGLSAEARENPVEDALQADAGIVAQDHTRPRKHRKRQKRPIELGTSGGNIFDFAIEFPFITCCSGTLGALVEKNGALYVLSNNHVLARVNQAEVGEPISQPGLLDKRCEAPAQNLVADLSHFKRIKINGLNKVDAALAEVREGAVDPSGAILGIGVPGSSAVRPQLGMAVQKSGRTTGHTRGTIVTVNVVASVGFPEECSESAVVNFVAFRKQFEVVGESGPFVDSGDSGSVIYEDADECPAAVGLAFAQDQTGNGFANPMKIVRKQLKKVEPRGPVKLVGCSVTARAQRAGTGRRYAKEVRVAERLQQRVEDRMLAVPGVVGMGIGLSLQGPGEVIFKIYVDGHREEIGKRIPASIEGFRTEIVDSGPIMAF